MTAPSSRKPPLPPPEDGERKPARKRKWTSIDEILPPRDLGPWSPEAERALTREEIYSDERP